jgi:hypothetical protein
MHYKLKSVIVTVRLNCTSSENSLFDDAVPIPQLNSKLRAGGVTNLSHLWGSINAYLIVLTQAVLLWSFWSSWKMVININFLFLPLLFT